MVKAKEQKDEVIASEVAKKETAPSLTEAAVHSQDGQHVRTYSRAIHGDNFHELAKEFAHRQGFEIHAH